MDVQDSKIFTELATTEVVKREEAEHANSIFRQTKRLLQCSVFLLLRLKSQIWGETRNTASHVVDLATHLAGNRHVVRHRHLLAHVLSDANSGGPICQCDLPTGSQQASRRIHSAFNLFGLIKIEFPLLGRFILEDL